MLLGASTRSAEEEGGGDINNKLVLYRQLPVLRMCFYCQCCRHVATRIKRNAIAKL